MVEKFVNIFSDTRAKLKTRLGLEGADEVELERSKFSIVLGEKRRIPYVLAGVTRVASVHLSFTSSLLAELPGLP